MDQPAIDGTGESPKTDEANLQRLGAGGVLLAIGMLLVTTAAACGGMPHLFGAELLSVGWALALVSGGVVLLGLGLVLFLKAMHHVKDPEKFKEPKRSSLLYGRHLGGIGVALLVDAAFTITIFVSLALTLAALREKPKGNALFGDTFDGSAAAALAAKAPVDSAMSRFEALFGSSAAETKFVAAMLVLSTFVALLGALFFFATSIWQKMDDPSRDPFDRSLFWAGLWFRIGEALVFNLVIFLVLRAYMPEQFLILPLVGLLVGMFLKSGEQLIAGLANRVFAAFTELLPSKPPAREVLRSLELPVGSVFAAGELTAKGKTLEQALKDVRGVSRVLPDAEAGVLRVEFDALLTSQERIAHEVRLHGVSAVPADTKDALAAGH